MSTETSHIAEPQKALPHRGATTAVWMLAIALIPASISYLNAQSPAAEKSTDSVAQPAASSYNDPQYDEFQCTDFIG